MTTTPRGIRNNNPGNIRRNPAVAWRGMAAKQTDPAFIVFDSPEWGIRALAKVLLAYRRKHGLKTVRAIIGRWAPPEENDTPAYVKAACKALECLPDDPIDVEDAETLRRLTVAIIRHENGQQPYAHALIRDAVAMALR